MSRFVRPDEVTLTISNGDTLRVRKRLTAGEKREAFSRMYQAGADGQLTRHPVLYGVHLVLAYLIDWSLTDDSGKKVDILDKSVDDLKTIVDALSPEDFTEILNAIVQHDDRVTEERAAAKKTHDGEPKSAATSPSPSAATGVLTTSGT